MKEQFNEKDFLETMANSRGVDINSDAVICRGIQKHAERFQTRNIPLEIVLNLDAANYLDAPEGGFSVFTPIVNKTILSKCIDSGLYANIAVATFCYSVYKGKILCWIQALTAKMEMVVIMQNSNEHYLIDLHAISQDRMKNAKIVFQSTERYQLAYMTGGRNTGQGSNQDRIGSLVYNLYEGSPSNQHTDPVTPTEQHIRKEHLLSGCLSKKLHEKPGSGGSIMLTEFVAMCAAAIIVSGPGALVACGLGANLAVMGIVFSAWQSCDTELRNEYGNQWDNDKDYIVV